MRFITFKSKSGQPHVGLLRDERMVLDLAEWKHATGPMPHFDLVDVIGHWQQWDPIIRAARETSEQDLRSQGVLLSLEAVQLMAPIPRPRKNILCMGRNYAEHAAESLRAIG